MSEQRQSLPCIKCGTMLYRVDVDSEGQPNNGLMLWTHGTYGSTLFDPMDGNYLLVNICDDCMAEAGTQGRVLAGRDRLPVQTDSVMSIPDKPPFIIKTIVGSRRIDRALVQWTKDVPEDDTEPEYIPIDEIVDYYDKDAYSWNLGLEHFAAMREEVQAVDALNNE